MIAALLLFLHCAAVCAAFEAMRSASADAAAACLALPKRRRCVGPRIPANQVVDDDADDDDADDNDKDDDDAEDNEDAFPTVNGENEVNKDADEDACSDVDGERISDRASSLGPATPTGPAAADWRQLDSCP